MRMTLLCIAACATVAGPSAAIADPGKDKKPKPGKPAKPYCMPKNVGYNATGTYVSGALTQTAGADTAKPGDDRYSGEVVVDVKRANHGAATGEQTFTLSGARVKFHPRNDTSVAAGDRVKLSGQVTKTGKKCAEATATVTVRKVDVKAAKSQGAGSTEA